MTQTEKTASFTSLVMTDAALAAKLACPAQLGYVPFMGQRDRFFLLANLDFLPEVQSREDLASHCLAAVRLILGSGLLSDEGGVEVSAWGSVAKYAGRNRLIRMSVEASAYPVAMKIEVEDLIADKHPGIRCRWPIASPEASSR